jgi:hypothetical protein
MQRDDDSDEEEEKDEDEEEDDVEFDEEEAEDGPLHKFKGEEKEIGVVDDASGEECSENDNMDENENFRLSSDTVACIFGISKTFASMLIIRKSKLQD